MGTTLTRVRGCHERRGQRWVGGPRQRARRTTRPSTSAPGRNHSRGGLKLGAAADAAARWVASRLACRRVWCPSQRLWRGRGPPGSQRSWHRCDVTDARVACECCRCAAAAGHGGTGSWRRERGARLNSDDCSAARGRGCSLRHRCCVNAAAICGTSHRSSTVAHGTTAGCGHGGWPFDAAKRRHERTRRGADPNQRHCTCCQRHCSCHDGSAGKAQLHARWCGHDGGVTLGVTVRSGPAGNRRWSWSRA